MFQGLEVTPANLARALSAVDPTLWAPPARPHTLSLSMPQPCTDPVRGNLIEYLFPENEKSYIKDETENTTDLEGLLFP